MSFMDRVLDKTTNGLERALDLQWRRNEALASNIANIDTPQYRAADLNFAGALERAFSEHDTQLDVSNKQHLRLGQNSASIEGAPHLAADLSGATRADGNNVDLDIQMGKMAQNSGHFNTTSTMLRLKLKLLDTVIREGMR